MTTPTVTTRETLDIQPLFAPRSITIVGASSNARGYSSRTLMNLSKTGYSGQISSLNSRHSEPHGLRNYARTTDICEPGDATIALVSTMVSSDAAFVLEPNIKE